MYSSAHRPARTTLSGKNVRFCTSVCRGKGAKHTSAGAEALVRVGAVIEQEGRQALAAYVAGRDLQRREGRLLVVEGRHVPGRGDTDGLEDGSGQDLVGARAVVEEELDEGLSLGSEGEVEGGEAWKESV